MHCNGYSVTHQEQVLVTVGEVGKNKFHLVFDLPPTMIKGHQVRECMDGSLLLQLPEV